MCHCPRHCEHWEAWELHDLSQLECFIDCIGGYGCNCYDYELNRCITEVVDVSREAFAEIYRGYEFDFDDTFEPDNSDFLAENSK